MTLVFIVSSRIWIHGGLRALLIVGITPDSLSGIFAVKRVMPPDVDDEGHCPLPVPHE